MAEKKRVSIIAKRGECRCMSNGSAYFVVEFDDVAGGLEIVNKNLAKD